MTEHEQGAEIAAAVGAAAGSTITRAEIVDDWLLALTFGDGSGQRLLVRTPWRLVNAEGLCLSSADDPERLRREASTLEVKAMQGDADDDELHHLRILQAQIRAGERATT